jgi:hypothetical protein
MKRLIIVTIASLCFFGNALAERVATPWFSPQVQVFEGKSCPSNPNGLPVVIVLGFTGDSFVFLLDESSASTEWLSMLKSAVANGKQVSIQYENPDEIPVYMLYNGETLTVQHRARCVHVKY